MEKRKINIKKYLESNARFFCVCAFENDKRISMYDQLGVIEAFEEVARRTARGNKILIIQASNSKEIINYEICCKCRASYEYVKQYAIEYKYNDIWELVYEKD